MKKGDEVERIAGHHFGMVIGDRDIISYVGYGSVTLKHYGEGHSRGSLRVIPKITNWREALK